jgi:hypothetical protein
LKELIREIWRDLEKNRYKSEEEDKEAWGEDPGAREKGHAQEPDDDNQDDGCFLIPAGLAFTAYCCNSQSNKVESYTSPLSDGN